LEARSNNVLGVAVAVDARASRTDARVRASRTAIAAAARDAFLTRGYAATTVADVARAAGCAVQTVYNTVGSKAAVLELVLDEAAMGPEAPLPVRARLSERAAGIDRLEDLLDLLVDWFVEVHPRIGPVLAVIEEAAAHAPEIADLARRRALARLDGYHLAAAELERLGALPRGCSRQEAAVTIWALAHPRVYALVTVELGWSVEDYRHWLRSALASRFATVAR
jgi:AcrR family transcriptional regulator